MFGRLPEIFATLVLPAFALAGVGWAVARWLPVPDRWLAGFRRLTFELLLPLYLVRTLASVRLPDTLHPSFLLAYYGVTLGLYAAVVLATRGRIGGPAANLHGLSAVYANAVLLGVPLITSALGADAAVPLFLLIAVHAPILALVTGVLGEVLRPRGGEAGVGPLLRDVARGVVRNPIIMAILLGLACNLLLGPAPAPIQQATAPLARFVPVAALLAMGIGLAGYRMRAALGPATGLAACKLLVHPLAMLAVMSLLPDLPVLWRNAAVLMAALPTGVNVYLFAIRQDAAAPEAAATIALTTPLSMLTLSLAMAALGV